MKPATLRRISPYGEHFFFGYYDLEPWNHSMTRYLAHRPSFIDRVQRAEDKVDLGYFDFSAPSRKGDGSGAPPFVVLERTGSWNFQQGAMLQWHPGFPEDRVIYNCEHRGRIGGKAVNLKTGEYTLLDAPVATVAPDGRSALSINFPRMYSFRPGYGYAGEEDPWKDDPLPVNDGIYTVDLDTGKARLLLSLAEIWERTAAEARPDPGTHKVLVNHITWNTDSSAFLFLLRYLNPEGGGWRTSVIHSDKEGRRLNVLVPFGYASHYWWTGPDTVLFHCDGPEGKNQYEINVKSGEFTLMHPELFIQDTHMRQLSGTPWVINDTYPHTTGYRELFLFNRRSKEAVRLMRFHSPPAITGDYRCDLHPRWSPDGRSVTFDSSHEGFRGIYSMDVAGITGV